MAERVARPQTEYLVEYVQLHTRGVDRIDLVAVHLHYAVRTRTEPSLVLEVTTGHLHINLRFSQVDV